MAPRLEAATNRRAWFEFSWLASDARRLGFLGSGMSVHGTKLPIRNVRIHGEFLEGG